MLGFAGLKRKFASKCDPDSLTRAIAKEASKSKSNDEIPNDFTLTLGQIDFQRLSSARVIKSLYEAVERLAIIEDAFIDGELLIRFKKSMEGSGLLDIQSQFRRDTSQGHSDSDTLIIEKETLEILRLVPMNFSSASEHEIARLTVLNSNCELIIGGDPISIGRKEICDLTLQDISISRVHASICYERHRHKIRDENSHNGTNVDGMEIGENGIFLRNGSQIKLGNTILRYEAI